MNRSFPLAVALHGDTDHGIANPWLLIPAAILASIYYVVVGVGSGLNRILARSIAPGRESCVAIGAVKVSPLQRRIGYADVSVTEPAGAAPGSVVTVGSVEIELGALSILGKRVEIRSLRLVDVKVTLPEDSGDWSTVGAPERDGRGSASDANAATGAGREWLVRVETLDVEDARIAIAHGSSVSAERARSEPGIALREWCRPATAAERVVALLVEQGMRPA